MKAIPIETDFLVLLLPASLFHLGSISILPLKRVFSWKLSVPPLYTVTMPHILICCHIRAEAGPTICGGEHSDPELMKYLGASLQNKPGNNFSQWISDLAPSAVLDKLEEKGYRVVSMAGAGQTVLWTMHRPLEQQQQ